MDVAKMLRDAKNDPPQQFYDKVLTAIDNTLTVQEFKRSVAILASINRQQEEGLLSCSRKGVYMALQKAIASEHQFKQDGVKQSVVQRRGKVRGKTNS